MLSQADQISPCLTIYGPAGSNLIKDALTTELRVEFRAVELRFVDSDFDTYEPAECFVPHGSAAIDVKSQEDILGAAMLYHAKGIIDKVTVELP
jgi:hypothetical protein